MGCAAGSPDVGCGKSVPTETLISVPLTERTALPGLGCEPDPPPEVRPPAEGDPGDEEPVPVPEPELEGLGEPPVVSLSESCWANGSLLSKRLNDSSWPVSNGGGTSPLTSEPLPRGGVVEGACSFPLKVGAARVGVPGGGAAVVEVVAVVVVAVVSVVGGGAGVGVPPAGVVTAP